MHDRYGPELSDVIVDYDPETLDRRPVRKADALAALTPFGRRRPLEIANALPAIEGVLDPEAMDGVLLRSHLELQRLHEECGVGESMRLHLQPLVALIRTLTDVRPLRVVDIGCGLGFVLRWLASERHLGDDVELIGVDYNRTLIAAAAALARAESLPCRFIAANAFGLTEPAHIYISTGVLHHFRGADLVRFFSQHEQASALACLHLDIRPSWLASFGSFVFHQARMREPLARWDGYFSAVRAHHASVLSVAAASGVPQLARGALDAALGPHTLVRIFQGVVAARTTPEVLAQTYAHLGRRFASATS